MEDSVFTKIIKNELPCHKVYEDELTIVIIPLYPIAIAHVLVIPKVQVDEFYNLDPENYNALMSTVQKVARRMEEVYGTKRIGLQIVGLDVPHCHVHVIAFNTLDEYKQSPDESQPINHDRLSAMASRLAF